MMLAAVGVGMILTLWLAALATVMGARLQVAAAADAAALAAAPVTFLPFGADGGPIDEATRFAAMNGAALVHCACPIDRSFTERTVTVAVARRVGLPLVGVVTVGATGRAHFAPARLLGPEAPG